MACLSLLRLSDKINFLLHFFDKVTHDDKIEVARDVCVMLLTLFIKSLPPDRPICGVSKTCSLTFCARAEGTGTLARDTDALVGGSSLFSLPSLTSDCTINVSCSTCFERASTWVFSCPATWGFSCPTRTLEAVRGVLNRRERVGRGETEEAPALRNGRLIPCGVAALV